MQLVKGEGFVKDGNDEDGEDCDYRKSGKDDGDLGIVKRERMCIDYYIYRFHIA